MANALMGLAAIVEGWGNYISGDAGPALDGSDALVATVISQQIKAEADKLRRIMDEQLKE
ncbi:hypothetical protein [Hydrogenimonas urashimensis]|uniref:hypothetical protein n=1 Tax=Hydrogenimonas urashimensis TaxID=2740515 RepID=UPI001915D66B|nr:hypothetical protein [Hydrogenimonas urashimensis]